MRSREDENAVTDGSYRTAGLPEFEHTGLQVIRAEVLPHARCVSARQEQPVELREVGVPPTAWPLELIAVLELAVVSNRVVSSTQLAEEHTGEQARVADGRQSA